MNLTNFATYLLIGSVGLLCVAVIAGIIQSIFDDEE
jgi:hypothetical protein